MLRAILNKSWKQHPTKQQLYGRLPPISKTIQIRRTRHAGHCWRSKNELISDVLQWTPSHGHVFVGRPAWIYQQQLCTDTGCWLEDLSEVMDDRDEWWERERESGKSVLAAWHDDNVNMDIWNNLHILSLNYILPPLCIYIYIYI